VQILKVLIFFIAPGFPAEAAQCRLGRQEGDERVRAKNPVISPMENLQRLGTELESRPGSLPLGGSLPLLRPVLCSLPSFNAEKGPYMTGKCSMDKGE